MSRNEILVRAEQFVRDTFSQDLKQNVDDKKIKEIAQKVARSIPPKVPERA